MVLEKGFVVNVTICRLGSVGGNSGLVRRSFSAAAGLLRDCVVRV